MLNRERGLPTELGAGWWECGSGIESPRVGAMAEKDGMPGRVCVLAGGEKPDAKSVRYLLIRARAHSVERDLQVWNPVMSFQKQSKKGILAQGVQ